MEFGVKLQELRKSKSLTQEELAEALYVSRTAISKWESGRGYPNIDSLKAIAKYFSVSLDQLLSGEEILTIAEEDNKEKETGIRNLVFGFLDFSTSLLFILPFFGQEANGAVQEVSLSALTTIQPWLQIFYYTLVIGMIIVGVFTLALQTSRGSVWTKNKHKLSLTINVLATVLFILSRQPYAAIFTLVFVIIKGIILIKK